MKFHFKSAFFKMLERYDSRSQRQILFTVDEVKNYLDSGIAAFGLRVKKIGRKSYEARVDDKLRIVWVKEGEEVVFIIIGNHEKVQHYLSHFEK